MHYVPNIANRSIRHQCKKYIYWGPTDDQPLIWKNSNGHISATGYPIHFMFGSMVGFSGSADWMALFPVWPNPRWHSAAQGQHVSHSKWKFKEHEESGEWCRHTATAEAASANGVRLCWSVFTSTTLVASFDTCPDLLLPNFCDGSAQNQAITHQPTPTSSATAFHYTQIGNDITTIVPCRIFWS